MEEVLCQNEYAEVPGGPAADKASAGSAAPGAEAGGPEVVNGPGITVQRFDGRFNGEELTSPAAFYENAKDKVCDGQAAGTADIAAGGAAARPAALEQARLAQTAAEQAAAKAAAMAQLLAALCGEVRRFYWLKHPLLSLRVAAAAAIDIVYYSAAVQWLLKFKTMARIRDFLLGLAFRGKGV